MLENREYCKRIAEEIEQYYNGEMFDDNGNQLGLYDCFLDVLDVQYIINGDLSYRAVKLYITLGGPTVWIDTYTKTIELRWANESASYCLLSDLVDEIDVIWEDNYNSMR